MKKTTQRNAGPLGARRCSVREAAMQFYRFCNLPVHIQSPIFWWYRAGKNEATKDSTVAVGSLDKLQLTCFLELKDFDIIVKHVFFDLVFLHRDCCTSWISKPSFLLPKPNKQAMALWAKPNGEQMGQPANGLFYCDSIWHLTKIEVKLL